jgi:hypothetical protein
VVNCGVLMATFGVLKTRHGSKIYFLGPADGAIRAASFLLIILLRHDFYRDWS